MVTGEESGSQKDSRKEVEAGTGMESVGGW